MSSSPDLPGFAPAVSLASHVSEAPLTFADKPETDAAAATAGSTSAPPTTTTKDDSNANPESVETMGTEEKADDRDDSTSVKPKSILRESTIAQKDAQRTDTVMNWIKGPTSKASVKMPLKKTDEGNTETTKEDSAALVEKEPETKQQIESNEVAVTTNAADNPDEGQPPVTDTFPTDKPTIQEANITTPSASVASTEQIANSESMVATVRSATHSPGPRRAKITAAKSVLLKQARKSPVIAKSKNSEKEKQPNEQKGEKRKREKPSVSSSGKKSRPSAAKEIWSGIPEENIGVDWTGWTKKTFERQSGKSKGSTDSYWYTPKEKYKLRSLSEIKRYVASLKKVHGDEKKAWNMFKSGK